MQLCSNCGGVLHPNEVHFCDGITETVTETTLLGEIQLVPDSTGHVEVIIDVAAVLAQCATRENAIDYLEKVAAIFAPKEATS